MKFDNTNFMKNLIYQNRLNPNLFLMLTGNGICDLYNNYMVMNEVQLNWWYKITDLTEEEAKLINAL